MNRRAAAISVLLALLATAAPAQTVPEPTDYRRSEYRAPVPETLAGATVVDAETAHALWLGGRVAFIDVLPTPQKPANLPEGTLWRDRPHETIPGSVWLPNVGYGDLAPDEEAYFRRGLAEATGGDLHHPVLIFCLADCWMSWNAARRAVSWGYSDVYWFPEGTDGWFVTGEDLVPVEAQPLRP